MLIVTASLDKAVFSVKTGHAFRKIFAKAILDILKSFPSTVRRVGQSTNYEMQMCEAYVTSCNLRRAIWSITIPSGPAASWPDGAVR
jgi:hypothetical protein